MRKIGKEVLFITAGEKNARNGEGSMIRLLDGRIMYAYTQFYSESPDDHAIARIAAYYSDDEGETWTDGGVLLEKDEDAVNIMAVSLIRLLNGDLGLAVLRKSMDGDKLLCMPYMFISHDDGKTFEKPIRCTDVDGYYPGCNHRMIRLSSGRLVYPAARAGDCLANLGPATLVVFYSDDDGQTWKSSEIVKSPYNDEAQLVEPGIIEYPDGKLAMWCRTAYGHQYCCWSEDGGEHWTGVEPMFRITSPDAPMMIKNVGKYTVGVYNPVADNPLFETREAWGAPKRTPLGCVVSRDNGFSFMSSSELLQCNGYTKFMKDFYLLEDNLKYSYAYPAVMEVKDGFLVAYYHSNEEGVCLSNGKITKVYFSEIED